MYYEHSSLAIKLVIGFLLIGYILMGIGVYFAHKHFLVVSNGSANTGTHVTQLAPVNWAYDVFAWPWSIR